jgi:hypothetical protein
MVDPLQEFPRCGYFGNLPSLLHLDLEVKMAQYPGLFTAWIAASINIRRNHLDPCSVICPWKHVLPDEEYIPRKARLIKNGEGIGVRSY